MKRFIPGILVIVICLQAVAQERDTVDWLHASGKGLTPAQVKKWNDAMDKFLSLRKGSGTTSELRSLIMHGNKIQTIVYNSTSISRPLITPNVLDLVWHGLGYGYEFGPLVGARVRDKKAGSPDSAEYKIVSEGFYRPREGEYGSDGLKWGWLPKAGYAAPGQSDIASWGARAKVNNDLRLRPPSWPESWYNSALGRYVWPSYLGSDASTPDEEVFFVADDYTKAEFPYYPFSPNDSLKRGLGVNLECRYFQFQNPLAEDIIFLVYTVENSSPRILPEVYFGMVGDPHIGGSNDYSDDRASFIPSREGTVFNVNGQDLAIVNGVLTHQRARNLVYAWDANGVGDIVGIKPGYFGYKFLESPSNSNDGIDNDDDGITDESPFNDKGQYIDGVAIPLTSGISNLAKYKSVYGDPKPRWSGDENGNWDINKDDVGIDGIPGTHDFGEGNGVPDQEFDATGKWLGAEPNFGERDVNESDQIGLRSFWALDFNDANNVAKNDQLMFDDMSSGASDVRLLYPPTTQDNIFLYGSGPFILHPQDRQRFSIALLFGEDLTNLLGNSEISQRVLEANYRFAQPPPKPHVSVVPGNGRVTLYWDTGSEEGVDPLTTVNDFEGYKIYRSEDFTFSDVFTITDGNGVAFLGKALYDDKAQKYAQWHLPWSDSLQKVYVGGFHPAEYQGRNVKYYMGEPTDVSGLRHQYIDSTVTNGKTYYYAVVAFDHGVYTDSLKLPPTETQSVISRDPVTQELKFDINTAAVVPGSPASGLVNYSDDIEQGTTFTDVKGIGTGKIHLKVLNPYELGNNAYSLTFAKAKVGTDSVLAYSIYRSTPVVENISGRDTLFVGLTKKNILASKVEVRDANNILIPLTSLVIDSAGGQIRGAIHGVLNQSQSYTVTYQYYPLVNSANISNQDANPPFDGIRPFVLNDPIAVDSAKSGFNVSTTNFKVTVDDGTVGSVKPKLAPLDVKIVFNSMEIYTSGPDSGKYKFPGDTLGATTNPVANKVVTPFRIFNGTDTTKLTVYVVDIAGKIGKWDPGDRLIVLTPKPYSNAVNTMMGIMFAAPDPPKSVNISGGEIFIGKTKKPFQPGDQYTFSTRKLTYDADLATAELKNVIVVPNPYVATSESELPTYRPDLRGDRSIQFRNLPVECTIRIYTLTGELVQTLHKNNMSNYITWDVLSSESERLGYGVYIYHVETPNGASKVGRLALIK